MTEPGFCSLVGQTDSSKTEHKHLKSSKQQTKTSAMFKICTDVKSVTVSGQAATVSKPERNPNND